MDSLRKRNASDGDSGFDSALSSRSSSISLEESNELLEFKVCQVTVDETSPSLRNKFSHLLDSEEDIIQDVCTPELYIIRDRVSGRETMYKPPSRLSFSSEPQIGETYSAEEYDRHNTIPRSQLFSSRLQLELEKQVAKMELVEVDLLMDPALVPPPSLGIRVIGVNMIHGVPDKLNIYVKRVMENSVAGLDNRIKVNDHIVEVNGVSLVGVSQKLAAEALSSCAVNPETSVVHFVLAREKSPALNLETLVADENQNLPLSSVPQDPPTLDAMVANQDPMAVKESLTPPIDGNSPPLLLAPSMLHCGESTAFIPLSPLESEIRLNLTDLPESVLIKISTYLSTEDYINLSNVNESFYQVLVKNLSELEEPESNLYPTPLDGGTKLPNKNGDIPVDETPKILENGKSLKHGLENLGDENIGTILGLGAKRRMDRVGPPGMTQHLIRPIHPQGLRSCI